MAEQLKIVARLIAGGLQTPLYLVRHGGFDTHSNQVEQTEHTQGNHANLLRSLDLAVTSFMTPILRASSHESDAKAALVLVGLRRSAFMLALFLPVAVLLPNSKTIVAMIALPPIINNENIQELPANLVGYLNAWLKENAKVPE